MIEDWHARWLARGLEIAKLQTRLHRSRLRHRELARQLLHQEQVRTMADETRRDISAIRVQFERLSKANMTLRERNSELEVLVQTMKVPDE